MVFSDKSIKKNIKEIVKKSVISVIIVDFNNKNTPLVLENTSFYVLHFIQKKCNT